LVIAILALELTAAGLAINYKTEVCRVLSKYLQIAPWIIWLFERKIPSSRFLQGSKYFAIFNVSQ
jgi:hypothetical protein